MIQDTQWCGWNRMEGGSRSSESKSTPLTIAVCSPGGSEGKESACSAGDWGLIPGWGRPPGGGHGNPSSVPAWRTPSAEEPGGLRSTGPQTSDMAERLSMHSALPWWEMSKSLENLCRNCCLGNLSAPVCSSLCSLWRDFFPL